MDNVGFYGVGSRSTSTFVSQLAFSSSSHREPALAHPAGHWGYWSSQEPQWEALGQRRPEASRGLSRSRAGCGRHVCPRSGLRPKAVFNPREWKISMRVLHGWGGGGKHDCSLHLPRLKELCARWSGGGGSCSVLQSRVWLQMSAGSWAELEASPLPRGLPLRGFSAAEQKAAIAQVPCGQD